MKRKMRVARAPGYRGGRGLGWWVGSYIWVVNVCQVTLVRRATRGRGMNKTLKPWSISLEWILKPWNISLEWIHIGNVSFCPADFETQKLKVWIKCQSLSIWPCAYVSAAKIYGFSLYSQQPVTDTICATLHSKVFFLTPRELNTVSDLFWSCPLISSQYTLQWVLWYDHHIRVLHMLVIRYHYVRLSQRGASPISVFLFFHSCWGTPLPPPTPAMHVTL